MPRKEKQHHFIYKTTNLINGKYYIGMHSTNNLNDGYIGSGKKLWYSIKKYGKENFKIQILEFLSDRRSLKEREKELVNDDLLIDPMCMNLYCGGEGGIFGVEHKKRALIGLKKGHEKQSWLWKNDFIWKEKKQNALIKSNLCNKYWVGKKHKNESKINIGLTNSIKQKGKLNSQFGTCWITNGFENKKIKKEFEIPIGWYKGRIKMGR